MPVATEMGAVAVTLVTVPVAKRFTKAPPFSEILNLFAVESK